MADVSKCVKSNFEACETLLQITQMNNVLVFNFLRYVCFGFFFLTESIDPVVVNLSLQTICFLFELSFYDLQEIVCGP